MISWRFVSPKLCNCASRFGTNWGSIDLQILFFCNILRKNLLPKIHYLFGTFFNCSDLLFIPLLLIWLLLSQIWLWAFAKTFLWLLGLYVDNTALPLFTLALLFFPFKDLYFSTKDLKSLHALLLFQNHDVEHEENYHVLRQPTSLLWV